MTSLLAQTCSMTLATFHTLWASIFSPSLSKKAVATYLFIAKFPAPSTVLNTCRCSINIYEMKCQLNPVAEDLRKNAELQKYIFFKGYKDKHIMKSRRQQNHLSSISLIATLVIYQTVDKDERKQPSADKSGADARHCTGSHEFFISTSAFMEEALSR